jgi:hypothetical protein
MGWHADMQKARLEIQRLAHLEKNREKEMINSAERLVEELKSRDVSQQDSGSK